MNTINLTSKRTLLPDGTTLVLLGTEKDHIILGLQTYPGTQTFTLQQGDTILLNQTNWVLTEIFSPHNPAWDNNTGKRVYALLAEQQ